MGVAVQRRCRSLGAPQPITPVHLTNNLFISSSSTVNEQNTLISNIYLKATSFRNFHAMNSSQHFKLDFIFLQHRRHVDRTNLMLHFPCSEEITHGNTVTQDTECSIFISIPCILPVNFLIKLQHPVIGTAWDKYRDPVVLMQVSLEIFMYLFKVNDSQGHS